MPKKAHVRPVSLGADKPGFGDLRETGKRFNQVSTDFLKVDLETALTFSGIALQTDNDIKKKRNQQSARKAYETIRKLMNNVDLDERDAHMLHTNLDRLKSELQRLGEVF